MQQNALLLHRWAHNIVRLRPFQRSPRIHLRRPTPLCRCAQARWASSSTAGGEPIQSHLGPYGHLGGYNTFWSKLPVRPEVKDDISAWLRVLDTCLPSSLRRHHVKSTESRDASPALHKDLSLILVEAQRLASIDIIQHLGVSEQRWDAVAWIINLIAARGIPPDLWAGFPSTMIAADAEGYRPTLDEVTDRRGVILERQPSEAEHMSLDQRTLVADPRFVGTKLQRNALGQIWQSLGSMIVRAAEEEAQRERLMPHILNLLAILHHHGIVPESVYREVPSEIVGSAQQPPLLHLFFPRILTALSDAAWDVHQATILKPKENERGQYTSWVVGPESPGVRYQANSDELRPEVWLELVLWSCLHGGWVQEGATILEQITPSQKHKKGNWSLICWQKVIETSQASQVHQNTFGWRDALDLLEGARPELQPRPSAEDKAAVVRTVSSEVVSAYIDASISQLHIGVGSRGQNIRVVIDRVKRWKRMLGRHNFGLGFATWDAIVQRFMESGGIWLERDPILMLEILQLVEPYGKEQEHANVATSADQSSADSPYFFGPSALPLNLLHRVLFTQAQTGAMEGTIKTLKLLQDFTELNQRRSIEQFFRNLKTRSSSLKKLSSQGLQFTTGLAAAEYPAFYPQIPVHVMAKFLDIAKDIPDHEFHKWIFYSGSAVGPLVSDAMYNEPGLAPAFVRFGSVTDNRAILENIMTHHSQLSEKSEALIPTPVLTALAETLIQRRLWPSLRGVLDSIIKGPGEEGFNGWDPRLMPTMIRELLLIEKESHNASKDGPNALLRAMLLFEQMVSTCLNMPRQVNGLYESEVLYCNLALLASASNHWAELVARMQILPRRSIPLRINTEIFNIVLIGVLQSSGLAAARRFWETWCHSADFLMRTAVAEGSLLRVPRYRPPPVGPPTESADRVAIETTAGHGGIDIAGRIRPDLHGAWIVLRAFGAEQKSEHLDYDVEEMKGWLSRYFEALNRDISMTATDLARISDVVGERFV